MNALHGRIALMKKSNSTLNLRLIAHGSNHFTIYKLESVIPEFHLRMSYQDFPYLFGLTIS